MTNEQHRKWPATAGIVGPLLFTTTFVVEGFWHPGYSHVADPVSALAAGPYGWVQDVNFVVFGALTIAFAIGVVDDAGHLAIVEQPGAALRALHDLMEVRAS